METISELSPEIQEKVAEVKSMPQDTPEHKAEKKEAAELLRMEMLLSTASLALETIEAIEANPDITRDEMIVRLRESGKVAFPEAIENFVNALYDNVSDVKADLVMLENASGNNGTDLATTFFRGLIDRKKAAEDGIDMEKFPTGQVNIRTDYPLAICIEVNEQDFNLIDPRKNIDGFYGAQYTVTYDSPWGEVTHSVPVIVSSGFGNQATKLHEQGHAENKNIMTSLELSSKYYIWGYPDDTGLMRNFERFMKPYRDDMQRPGTSSDEVLADPRSKKVIKLALAYAKDEILADMKTGAYMSIENKRKGLVLDNGVYVYFSQDPMNIEKDSVLHNTLWEEYKTALAAHTIQAEELFDTYVLNPNFEKRARLFRFVLAQIPMEKWNETLQNSMFVKEMQMHEALKDKIRKVQYPLRRPPLPNIPKTPEEVQMESDAENLLFELNDMIKANSDRPMIEMFEQYELRVQAAQDALKETDLYKVGSMYNRANELYLRALYALPSKKTAEQQLDADELTKLRAAQIELYTNCHDYASAKQALEAILSGLDEINAKILPEQVETQ